MILKDNFYIPDSTEATPKNLLKLHIAEWWVITNISAFNPLHCLLKVVEALALRYTCFLLFCSKVLYTENFLSLHQLQVVMNVKIKKNHLIITKREDPICLSSTDNRLVLRVAVPDTGTYASP